MLSVPQKDTEDPEIAVDKVFGARVRSARKLRGWSQTELGRACVPPVSQATISAIERGKGQSSCVLAVCLVLGIDPPTVGESPEMRRWIDVGRALFRHPDVMRYHLAALEQVARALAAAKDASASERRPSARH